MASKYALRIMKSARAGDGDSQFQFGMILLDGGEGFAVNRKSAYSWLSRAAAGGHEAAWRVIGERIQPEHADGDERLFTWYRMAADAGSGMAAFKLGRQLLTAPNGIESAERWLAVAAEGGIGEACLELGRLRLRLAESGEAMAAARRLLTEAWHQGWQCAARELADHYWNRRDLRAAREWYFRCPNSADPEVLYRLGLLQMLTGQSGIDFLQQAAAAGHVPACEELGMAYAVGVTGGHRRRRNFKQAVRWFELAANGGSARAAYLLALTLRHSTSTQRDLRASRVWMFRAARRGHPDACYNAGIALVRDISAARIPDPADVGGEDADVLAVRFLFRADRSGVAGAGEPLRRLASRALMLSADERRECEMLAKLLAEVDPELALRVRIGLAMGLSARELVAFDPTFADRGECFVVDLHAWRASYRRRIVLVERPDQRAALDEARCSTQQEELQSLRVIGKAAAVSRYRSLRRMCRRDIAPGIESRLFPRAT